MNIDKAIIEAVVENFQMFGLSASLVEEVEERSQLSGEQVNILIGLTDAMKGNVIMGLKKNTAQSIVSSMMGGMEVKELDFMAKSALGELANMTVGSAIMKLRCDEKVNLSPPTVIIGEAMDLTLSGRNSIKLMFSLNNELFNMVLSTE